MITKKPYVITEIIKETPDVSLFKFKAQDGSTLSYDPGMFVMIHYRNPQTGEEIGRAFSLASKPDDAELEFAISMIHGRFTSHLDTANVGDVYYFSGPYGQFKYNPTENKKVLFVAGGTGVAPFLSMLRLIDEKKYDTDVKLIYSMRHPEEIIRKGELDSYKSTMKFDYVITVTRQETDADKSWQGEHGHVDAEMIKRHLNDTPERTCYVCGPLKFTKAVQDALTAIGVDKSRIKADVWGE
ncbi:MAG: FAD-dependent oxidoreductase [Candidatus Micrarchaeota archaeon]|nr:FAD-dependent oxidoreductase [Candidatus Micrarchaeota archaeon]MDE1846516.1 FAD-dependent oxidoreductase [Candidatus Micrarchaeota archaeon]